MSTDRNEKISNHEKDMARDSFTSGEWDRTHSVFGVQNVIILGYRMWLQVCGVVACTGSGDTSLAIKPRTAGLEGKDWNGKVMFGAPWCGLCVSVASFGRLLEPARSSKPKQAEHFRYLSNIFFPKGSFEKGVLGPHKSPLVHIQISACRWRSHLLHVLVSESRVRYPCAAPPLAALLCQAALLLSCKPMWLPAPLCLMATTQTPASEPLSPRENCFNLIKWRWNLKWLNVYLLTGRDVL